MGKSPKPSSYKSTNGSDSAYARVRHGHVDMTCPLRCGLWYVKVTETEIAVHWLHEIDESGEHPCPLTATRMSAVAVVDLLLILSRKMADATGAERKRIILQADQYVAALTPGRPDYLAGAKALLSHLANEDE